MIEDYFQLFWRSWHYSSRYQEEEKRFCQGLFEVIYRQFPTIHWKVEIEPAAKKYKRRTLPK